MQKRKTQLLNELFCFLTEQNISYCVVGDSLNLPEEIPSDIDIVISKENFKSIKEKVYLFTTTRNCETIQMLQHEQTACDFLISFTNENKKISFIHPDFCSDYYRYGKPLIKASSILKGIKLAQTLDGANKTFFVASAEMEFLYYLIKKCGKNNLNQKHFEHLYRQYKVSPNKVKERLLDYWQNDDVEIIIKAMNNKDIEGLENILPILNKRLNQQVKLSLKAQLKELKRKIVRFLQPTGIIIAILGPDGVGKTVFGEQLKLKLEPAFRGTRSYYFRPYVFGENGSGLPITNPQADKFRSNKKSFAALFYFFMDCLLGYFSCFCIHKVKSNLILFDCYYHDLLIVPNRYLYSSPMWIAKLIGRLVPKPDLYIILDAPVDIVECNQEESFEVIMRQRDGYTDFSKSRHNCIIITADTLLENTVEVACSAILEYMANRIKMRLGKG